MSISLKKYKLIKIAVPTTPLKMKWAKGRRLVSAKKRGLAILRQLENYWSQLFYGELVRHIGPDHPPEKIEKYKYYLTGYLHH